MRLVLMLPLFLSRAVHADFTETMIAAIRKRKRDRAKENVLTVKQVTIQLEDVGDQAQSVPGPPPPPPKPLPFSLPLERARVGPSPMVSPIPNTSVVASSSTRSSPRPLSKDPSIGDVMSSVAAMPADVLKRVFSRGDTALS